MTYRDDRDALRERIEQLEKKIASAVSPAELAAVRAELASAKSRIDSEREALDALLDRLGAAPPKRSRRGLLFAAVALLVLAAGAGAGFALVHVDGETSYEGAPSAVRARPVRREIDVELARLMPDLDGCLPEGDHARIQVDLIFEGRDGAIREISHFNVSESDSYPMSTPECLTSVLQGVGTAPFRAPSYRYSVTLEWTDEGLERPALWDRYDLAADPRAE